MRRNGSLERKGNGIKEGATPLLEAANADSAILQYLLQGDCY